MTRGTAYLITNNEVITHDEFNGDMYPGERGNKFYQGINKCTTPEQFIEFINRFNQEEFQYKDFNIIKRSRKELLNKKGELNFTDEDYYERFFSDYIFFHNLSTADIPILNINGDKFTLYAGCTMAFYFGKDNATLDFEKPFEKE